MSKRVISDRQRGWLLAELDAWRKDGILSQDQLLRVLERYETSTEISERKRSHGVFVLMGVAALLVGLAVLLLIGYNWEALPGAVKLAIIFVVLIGTHATAFALRYRRRALILSEVVFFLACLFYGAGIWLIAQIFNLNAHYPDGIWLWALGVLPLALCLDTLLLHALLVALLALWAGVEILGFGTMGAWLFGRWPALANGAYTLPLLALPGLLWGYRKASPVTVGLYAALLAWWVILQPFAWHWEANSAYFIASVGGLFLIVAETHRPGSGFAIPYRLFGVLLSAGALVPISFHGFNQEILRGNLQIAGLVQTLVIVILAVATIAASALIQQKIAGDQLTFPERLREVVRRQWLPVSLVVLMAFLSFWNTVSSPFDQAAKLTALVPTLLANIAMVVFALWLMRLGLGEDRARPFSAGVSYFLLWSVLRYVDLFGDFGGMLGAALMFFLCGAALFGVALYWRRRKEVQHA